MTTAYKLIVFDWDGTLMDSVARIVASMRAAITDLVLPQRTEVELRNVIGLGLREALTMLYPEENAQILGELTERYRHYYLYADPTPAELFTGMKSLLTTLNDRGYYLAIATGKSRTGLTQALEKTAVGGDFHTTRSAEETISKPHPRMLEEIMTELGVAPAATLMIGDSVYDIQMAHNAGAKAVAVCYGVHERPRLAQMQPLACLDTTIQMQQWLLNTLVPLQQTKSLQQLGDL